MARTSSKGSTSPQYCNLAFTGSMPPSLISDSSQEMPVDPWSPCYTYQPQCSPSQQRQEIEHGLENVGEDPAVWITRTSSIPLTPSPVSIPPSATPIRTRPCIGTPQSYNMTTPTTSTSGSLTNATTLTSNMSRQSSLCNEPLLESMQMMKFNSNTSFFSTDNNGDDPASDQVTLHYTSSHQGGSSNEEQSHLLRGLGGASHHSQFSHPFPTATELAQFHCPSFSGENGEKMEKSLSNESTSSSSSSRSKERLKAQIQTAAARPLAPKGDEHAMLRDNSSQSMTRLESKDGSQDKIAISKPTYQRPKHDRVYCNECDDHPDGFRGEHELRRHKDRQHKKVVKKWVCVQPVGLDHPKPILPLSRCKACAQQKKKYNAYYNAAAHLRRAHFRPKAKGRTKTSKVDDANKRGGKAGGDWPSMPELKHWMKEVEELAEYPLTASQQEEDESEDENCDIPEEPSPLAMNSMAGGSFDTSIYTTPDTSFNIYPLSTNESFSMHSMQCLPQYSQQMNCGQNNFDNFSFPQNEPFAFSETSSIFIPQPFDDQSLGLDPVNFSF